MQVANDDIASLIQRVDRYANELIKSASSNVVDVNTFDQTRIQSYLNSLNRFLDWVVATPQLDCPETHPSVHELEDLQDIQQVENQMINDLVQLFVRLRGEAANCASARNATGLISHDNTRFRSYIDKAQAYLTDYIIPTTPLDAPETVPSAAMSGPGNTGI